MKRRDCRRSESPLKSKLLLILMLVLAASLIIGYGCGNDSNNDGVPDDIAPPNFYIEVDPGVVDTLCCATEFVSLISGVSPPGGRYYWGGLHVQDSLMIYGAPVFIPEGPYVDWEVGVQVSYLDQVPSQDYYMTIYSSDSYGDVGRVETRATASTAGLVHVVSYVDSQCFDCCTGEGDTIFYSNGDTVVGLRRYKAFALKRVTDADFARSWIDTEYGRLCAEGTAAAYTDSAQQNCFVCLLEHAGQYTFDPAQLQCGWIHYRFNGVPDTAVYFEVSYPNAPPQIYLLDSLDGIQLPGDGTRHEYDVARLDDTVLVGFYDGRMIVRIIDPGWAGISIEYVSWQAEIAGRETDMPGTKGDSCEFFDCRYRIKGQTTEQSASFDNSSTTDTLDVTPQKGPRPPEWGIDYRRGTGDFWVWDEDPLK